MHKRRKAQRPHRPRPTAARLDQPPVALDTTDSLCKAFYDGLRPDPLPLDRDPLGLRRRDA